MVRRMLPAVVASVLVATGTSSFAGQLIQQVVEAVAGPRRHEAVAWLRVLSDRGTGPGTTEYETFRRTQVQLITSPEILRAALDWPEIAQLDALRDVDDKVDWLANHVVVEALPESEVMQIRLRGDDPREAASLVDAVATASADKMNKQERAERLERQDALEKKYKENMAEIRARLEKFNNLARSLMDDDSVALRNANGELEAQRNDIAQLQAVTNQSGIQLEASKVELAMPNRVEIIEPASDTGRPEEVKRRSERPVDRPR